MLHVVSPLKRFTVFLLSFGLAPVICHAQSMTVQTPADLKTAIEDANNGLYKEIVIDTNGSALNVSSNYLSPVLLGNGGINSGYVIGNNVPVTIHGDNVSMQSFLTVDGLNDLTQDSVLTFRNVNLTNYYTALTIKNARVAFEGGNLDFTGNSRSAFLINDTNTLNNSSVGFYNSGNIKFSGYEVFTINETQPPSGVGVQISFHNAGDIIGDNIDTFMNIDDSSGYFVDFNNAGNVAFTDTGNIFYITNGFDPGTILFRNEGDIFSSGSITIYGEGDDQILFYNQGDVHFTDSSGIYGTLVGKIHFANAGDVTFMDSAYGGCISLRDNAFRNADLIFDNLGDVAFIGSHNSSGGAVTIAAEGAYVMNRYHNQGNLYFLGNYSGGSATYLNGGGGAISFENKVTQSLDIIFESSGNTYFHDNISGTDKGAQPLPLAQGGAISIMTTTAFNKNLVFSPTDHGYVEFKNNWQSVFLNADQTYDFSYARSNAIYIGGGTITLNPADKGMILFRDPILSTGLTTQIVQDGPGTTRMWNGWDYAKNDIAEAILGGQIIINDGRLLAMDNAVYATGATNRLTMTVNGGEFGVSIDTAGGHSKVIVETFQAANGAKLYVTGVSTFEEGESTKIFADVVETTVDPIASVPTSMRVNNQFMDAALVQNGSNWIDLHLYRVNSVQSVLGGQAAFLDDMRRNPSLPEPIRWAIDDLYNYGEFTRDTEDLLRSSSGTDVANSLNAVRTNSRIFHQTMLDRLLQLDENAAEFCRSANSCCLIRTSKRNSSQIWGTFVQDWTEQKDSGLLKSNYSYHPFLLMFGKDIRAGSWNLGLAFQYARGVTRNAQLSPTKTQNDSATLGLYMGRNFGQNYLKITGQAGIGRNETQTWYQQNEFGAEGRFLTGVLGAGLEFGRVLCLGRDCDPWNITPHVGAEYYWIASESFRETDGKSLPDQFGVSNGYDLSRRFDNAGYHVIDIPIGFRVSKTFRSHGRLTHLRPSVDLAFVRSVGDKGPAVDANFLVSPGHSWRAYGSSMGREAFRLNVAMDARFQRNWNISCQYGLEARSRNTSQQVSVSLIKQW